MLSLRPYQQAAIGAIYAYFEDHKGNPLIVIPTAGGKSLVLAAFSEGVLKAWPDQRILIVTHVRELIAQNHAEMIGLWPEAPAGIYSAGLGKREADARILFAGIQSVHRKAAEIGHCDLVLIDEAHLIPRRLRHHVPPLPRRPHRHQPEAQGDRLHGDALPARQRHAARGRRGAVHRHRLRGLGPRPDRQRLSLPAGQQAAEDEARCCRRRQPRRRVHRQRVAGRGRQGGDHQGRRGRDHRLRSGSQVLARLLLRRRSRPPCRGGVPRARHQLRHDLRRYPEGRARPHHCRLQAAEKSARWPRWAC